jgi:aminoglycoside phosphotransferase (APT) family kinase protein
MGGTEIVGETVHRSTGRWTPAVHALLRYLESVRFSGAPRLVGFDEIGREILSYLPSETRSRRDVPKSAEALEALGRLLRSYHEAVSDFEPPHDAVWRLRRSAEAGMIICHNDVNPGNVVYRGGLPYGLIDWDLAGPAWPLTELVRACILFVPLLPDDLCRAWGFAEIPDRKRRLALLCESYGAPADFDVLAAAEQLHVQDLADLDRYGRAGVSPYDTFLATGSEAATKRDLDWLRAHRAELRASAN